jgi:hypothetical protein
MTVFYWIMGIWIGLTICRVIPQALKNGDIAGAVAEVCVPVVITVVVHYAAAYDRKRKARKTESSKG